MITAIVCVAIGCAIVAGLSRVADKTGAAVRDFNEKLANFHERFDAEYSAESHFFTERKWEVKVD